MIQYRSIVLLCRDISISTAFYQELFGLQIALDLGKNVCFSGGLSIWEIDYAKNLLYGGSEPDLPQEKPRQELYFETDDIASFVRFLEEREIRLLHPIQEAPWTQRVIRFFDPDGHLIEMGESMESVVLRHGTAGLSTDEIVTKTMMPKEFVTAVLSGS